MCWIRIKCLYSIGFQTIAVRCGISVPMSQKEPFPVFYYANRCRGTSSEAVPEIACASIASTIRAFDAEFPRKGFTIS